MVYPGASNEEAKLRKYLEDYFFTHHLPSLIKVKPFIFFTFNGVSLTILAPPWVCHWTVA